MSHLEVLNTLKAKGLKITPQRVEVLRFLEKNRIHPTAQRVYDHVVAKVGSVSFTTIYNTLHLLEKIGAIKRVVISENTTVYDVNTKPHGHFVCRNCGQIFDIDFRIFLDGIPGQVNAMQLVAYGICKECLNSTGSR